MTFKCETKNSRQQLFKVQLLAKCNFISIKLIAVFCQIISQSVFYIPLSILCGTVQVPERTIEVVAQRRVHHYFSIQDFLSKFCFVGVQPQCMVGVSYLLANNNL